MKFIPRLMCWFPPPGGPRNPPDSKSAAQRRIFSGAGCRGWSLPWPRKKIWKSSGGSFLWVNGWIFWRLEMWKLQMIAWIMENGYIRYAKRCVWEGRLLRKTTEYTEMHFSKQFNLLGGLTWLDWFPNCPLDGQVRADISSSTPSALIVLGCFRHRVFSYCYCTGWAKMWMRILKETGVFFPMIWQVKTKTNIETANSDISDYPLAPRHGLLDNPPFLIIFPANIIPPASSGSSNCHAWWITGGYTTVWDAPRIISTNSGWWDPYVGWE